MQLTSRTQNMQMNERGTSAQDCLAHLPHAASLFSFI